MHLSDLHAAHIAGMLKFYFDRIMHAATLTVISPPCRTIVLLIAAMATSAIQERRNLKAAAVDILLHGS
ncbi:hypothetical protein C2S51_036340 [Perilla frutescens var. frutescens]|nr:hypothetical protein C2S51_036340 [Perilla frutescens var. frutescens]